MAVAAECVRVHVRMCACVRECVGGGKGKLRLLCALCLGVEEHILLTSPPPPPPANRRGVQLPPSQPTVGLPLPSCLKITHDFPNPDVNTEYPNPTITLDKSYSPISLPDAEGHFDLLVKGYEPRQGGGLGRYLTDLNVGDTALAKMKAPRIIHDDIYRPGRWSKIGFVAAGTARGLGADELQRGGSSSHAEACG